MLNEMSPYILLGFLFAGLLHVFVRQDVMSKYFSGNGFKQSFKAALIGVPLPLCSCGVLPTAIALRRNGASTAATTSFLIATPQTGVDSIVATYSLLGLPFAILRPVAAFVTAVLGGCIMGRLSTIDTPSLHNDKQSEVEVKMTFAEKIKLMIKYGFVDMVASVGKWLVIGLIIAALITVLVPNDFFVTFAERPILAMIAVVVIAVPMYVCATGSIPIALSLMLKGLTPGVAFVFLMAGPAVNFASYTLLSHTLGRRNTLIYIAIIAISAICIGSVVDYFLPENWFVPKSALHDECCHNQTSWINLICSAILCALLLYSLIINKFKHKIIDKVMTKEYRINGMMCVHCKGRVEKGLSSVEGVTSVTVDLDKKVAIVAGSQTDEAIESKVMELGYEYVGVKRGN
jgi:hypothetical protein